MSADAVEHSHLLVNIFRTLLRCERSIVSGDWLNKYGERIRLQKNIVHLREMITVIEMSKDPPLSVVNHLKQQLQHLTSLLNENKLVQPSDESGSNPTVSSFISNSKHLAQSQKNVFIQREIILKRKATSGLKAELMEKPQTMETSMPLPSTLTREELFLKSDQVGQAKSEMKHEISEDKGSEEWLRIQRRLQEASTRELIGMSSKLKEHSLTFSEKLVRDKKVISQVRQLLSSDLEELSKQKGNLSKFTERAKKTSCLTWLAILLVIPLFMSTFIMIRMLPIKK